MKEFKRTPKVSGGTGGINRQKKEDELQKQESGGKSHKGKKRKLLATGERAPKEKKAKK